MGERAPQKRNERDKLKQDDFVMGTNNSSIVSKRSVEKLYFPSQPQLFRYFVKKFQRRAPLINRGYWLRMHAVDHVVRKFIKNNAQRQKYVINLGCGYDPLPFKFLRRDRYGDSETTFIDVDYPKLMRIKCKIVQETPSMSDLLENIQINEVDEGVLLQSKSYNAIGCDLCQLNLLENSLKEVAYLGGNPILFVAEVSLTYMEHHDADALIQWASRIDNARFCLMEQFLPSGPDHPFALTMLNHFNKIQTPLKSISRYSSKNSQCLRFYNKGWLSVEFESLWEIWQCEHRTSTKLRQQLDDIELFDEWEEFALFACHYFLLVASTSSDSTTPYFSNPRSPSEASQVVMSNHSLRRIRASSSDVLTSQAGGYRRFAAAIEMSAVLGLHGGIGKQRREMSLDVYVSNDSQHSHVKGPPLSQGIACHTITRFNNSQFLLVGGRTSPDKANINSWHYDGMTWSTAHVLVPGRFRHCAITVLGEAEIGKTESYKDEGILVFGGRTGDGRILDEWAIWEGGRGWRRLRVNSEDDISSLPRFGACMFRDDSSNSGWLFGGIGNDRLIQSDAWRWTLDTSHDIVNLVSHTCGYATKGPERLDRFGASVAHGYEKHQFNVIAGGITGSGLPDVSADILLIGNNCNKSKNQEQNLKLTGIMLSGTMQRHNLNIGASVISPTLDQILVIGGGAVCFSFGTYWNKACVINLETDHTHTDRPTWCLSNVNVAADDGSTLVHLSRRTEQLEPKFKTQESNITPNDVPHMPIIGEEDFLGIIVSSRPVIIENLDLGKCVEKWSNSYLKQAIGAERKVVVHSSKTADMNFEQKNFEYVTMTFGDFLSQVEDNRLLYMRAVSSSEPGAKPSNLATDFPSIAGDFKIPTELSSEIGANMHSSPLRISGPVRMWLHYDVMANILCQIRGTKRLRLFPPSAHAELGFKPGSTTSSVNAFDDGDDDCENRPGDGAAEKKKHKLSSKKAALRTHCQEAILNPGDVLYIPPLWPHAVDAPDRGGDDENEVGTTVAVNIFFRTFEPGRYAPGKDVYGNRDVQAYEQGRLGIARIARAFEGLPGEVRRFYVERLAGELFDMAAGG